VNEERGIEQNVETRKKNRLNYFENFCGYFWEQKIKKSKNQK
jgi:hypothetical protein